MLRQRLVAALAALAALFLLVYGATVRTHRVAAPSGHGPSVIEVDDPLVIQATCTGEVTVGADGRLKGDPSTWGDTAGKACPT